MLLAGCLLAIAVYAADEQAKPAPAPAPAPADPNAEAKEQKAVALVTEMDKISYAIGTQIGQSLSRQEMEINVETLIQGLRDSLAGKELAMSQQQMQQLMMAFQQRMMAKQQQRQQADQAKGAENLAAGKAFLEANKDKEGVKVLPSGLQYKIIKEGTGKTPTATDKVKTNYRGTLIDGTEFDSSYKRNQPAEFAVKGVIPGWTEALQLMKEGAKWQLYIPADLAYRDRARPTIPANSTLIFDIELIEIVK
jgi:FKBP-type peptidyl-prolyl cis-trans isomerase FklB